MNPTYLDHAATTPMRQAALAAYAEAVAQPGNASSQHSMGRRARRVVEESREQIAALLGAKPSEVIFTSGGTEADNLAIKGVFLAQAARGRTHVVVSAIEHHAVLDPARWLQQHHGAHVSHAPVGSLGQVDVAALEDILAANADTTAIVSVMWANNEVGTIQPIDQVVAAAARYGIPVHSDAVQAIGTLPVDFSASGLSAMTVGAHKVGGPVGVGALVARRDLPLTELTSGGGQERSVRSGTLDVAGVRAFAVALEETVRERAAEAQRLEGLRARLVAGIQAQVPGAIVRGVLAPTGPAPAQANPAGSAIPAAPADAIHATPTRLSSIANVTFTGCEGDSLLFSLDSRGVCASTGSACQAGVPQASHVLLAMGIDEDTARGALRFSLGHTSTDQDVDAVLAVLPEAVERARSAGLTTRAHKPLTAVEA